MRTLLIVSLIGLGSINAWAQKKITEFALSEKRLYPKACIARSEDDNSFYLSIVTKEYIKRFYINKNGEDQPVLFQAKYSEDNFPAKGEPVEEILQLYNKQTFVTGLVAQNKMIDIFLHERKRDFVFIETDLETGASILSDTLQAGWRDELVHSFIKDGAIVLMIKKYKTNYFTFHSKALGKKLKSDTLRIALSDFEIRNRKKNIFDFNETLKVFVQPMNLWIPIPSADYVHRAYTQKDRFIVTLNAPDASTSVLDINLRSFTYTINHYRPVAEDGEDQFKKNSSLLINSLLITAAVGKTSLIIHFIDTKTGEVIKKQEITKDNFSRIGNSPIQKTGSFWAKSDVSEIDFDEFLKKAAQNQLQLTGYIEKDAVYITFGFAYNTPIDATLIGNLLTLGTLGFSQSKPRPTISFNATFELNTFSAQKKQLKNAVWDKMLMHVYANRHILSDLSFFYMNGFFYIGNPNISLSKFAVYRFDEKAE